MFSYAMEAVDQNKARLDAGLNDLDLYDLATNKREYTSPGGGVPTDDWVIGRLSDWSIE